MHAAGVVALLSTGARDLQMASSSPDGDTFILLLWRNHGLGTSRVRASAFVLVPGSPGVILSGRWHLAQFRFAQCLSSLISSFSDGEATVFSASFPTADTRADPG